jgi:NitT/TauT family transport system substrate-binding protein
VGIQKGFFTKELGSSVTLKLTPFSSGTQEATALLAGQLDAAYVGPNPTIKAWQTSNGTLIKVISGAASGGAELVVKSGITSATKLKGQSLATPSLGNTQDYDVQMVADGGRVLVNEASLWPGGQFVTTDLVVTQSFLAAHPSAVSGLLKGQIDANTFIHQHTAAAEAAANAELTSATGKGLKSSVLSASFQQITFTNDPIASSLAADAQHAVAVGLLKPVSNITGLYDLGPLNKLLAAAGEPQVSP